MAIDPNIKKKADDIRNKIYGKEVRESLASGLEEMSSDVVENEGRQSVVEGRQDSVESQWQTVSDEMTDKDVISAPEIIAARNGESNLKARLDKENQEVTAQFAQTKTLINDFSYTIKDFPRLDGETNDTLRIERAIEASIEDDKNLFFPEGEYIVTEVKGVLTFGKSFKMYGVGRGSVIKREDYYCTKDWQCMFSLRPPYGEGTFNTFTFENIKLDGNARKNVLQPDGEAAFGGAYGWEHSANVYICGRGANSRIKEVLVKNVVIDDCVADGFYFAGLENTWIDSIKIDGVTVDSRTQERSDICLTGGTAYFSVNNFDGGTDGKLETELNRPFNEGTCVFHLSNIKAKILDIGGGRGTSHLTATNVIAERALLGGLTGSITNSDLTFEGSILAFMKDFTLDNCDIRINPIFDEDGLETLEVNNIRINSYTPLLFRVRFSGCRFWVNSDTDEIFSGYAISQVVKNQDSELRIENCYFEDRFQNNIKADRCGTVHLINNDYSSSEDGHAIYFMSKGNVETLNGTTNLFVTGGIVDRVSGTFIYAGECTLGTLSMTNLTLSEEQIGPMSGGVTGYGNPSDFIITRVILVDSTMTDRGLPAFVGDRYRLKNPIPGEPYEWVATNTHPLSATTKVISTVGI